MIDQKTLSYVNLFAVLGTIENLCEIDDSARSLLKNKKPVSIGFFVKDGPQGVLTFANGGCTMKAGKGKCDICLPFSSAEKFNGMINGSVTPIPSKGFTKIKFLLKDFTALTDRLTELLRPKPEALADADFKNKSTTLMCYTIASAISQIGNHDEIGSFSAAHIADGEIAFEVTGGPAITIVAKNKTLSTIKKKSSNPRVKMEFASLDIARDVFDGKENSMSCVCEAKILMTGLISMIDNVNRILDRVSLYLS